MRPVIYLLCGLPGSGKTTYAKDLEKVGITRLTLDERLFEKFGREYTDHKEKQAQTEGELRELLAENVRAGKSVSLDFGFWKKTARDEYKTLAEKLGADWKLLYFKVDKNTLMERLASRNITDSIHNHIIDETLLGKFILEFEEPMNEGETVVVQSK